LKPILCVSPEPSVTPGIATDVFEEAGVPCRMVRAWEDTQWPNPEDIGGLLLLGGDMSAEDVDNYPFLRGVHGFTEATAERGSPVLGICLGAQILALVLGGQVRRSPRVELGFTALDATDEGKGDPILGRFAGDVAVFQWHEDTFSLPPAATLLLSGGGFHQAFRSGAALYGAQFHFEVTERDVAAWIEATPAARLQEYWGWSRDDLLAEASIKLPAQQKAGRDAFRRWAEMVES
jgi:GMP synthase (glutamine-hydrolysing)